MIIWCRWKACLNTVNNWNIIAHLQNTPTIVDCWVNSRFIKLLMVLHRQLFYLYVWTVLSVKVVCETERGRRPPFKGQQSQREFICMSHCRQSRSKQPRQSITSLSNPTKRFLLQPTSVTYQFQPPSPRLLSLSKYFILFKPDRRLPLHVTKSLTCDAKIIQILKCLKFWFYDGN